MAEDMQTDIHTLCGGVNTGLSALRVLCLDPEDGPDATLAIVAVSSPALRRIGCWTESEVQHR